MKGRKHRETGGRNDAKEDLDSKPMHYTADSNVNREAEERKRGGKARKNGGKAEGGKAEMRADRKPRKSGGRANATDNPFSSAKSGSGTEGHKTMGEMLD